jgi:hypothetical protein
MPFRLGRPSTNATFGSACASRIRASNKYLQKLVGLIANFHQKWGHHEKAVRLARETRRAVVVTEFVLLELANALARAGSRKLFVDLLPRLIFGITDSGIEARDGSGLPSIGLRVTMSCGTLHNGCRMYEQ